MNYSILNPDDTRHKDQLYLFHGTGGNSTSLFQMVDSLQNLYEIIGLEGEVLENGHKRFFRRLREGVFDEKDLQERADSLSQWLRNHSKGKTISALGYSNGANMIGALLYIFPTLISHAVLLRPMKPFRIPPALQNSPRARIVLSFGKYDQFTTSEQNNIYADELRRNGYQVEVMEWDSDHRLLLDEVNFVIGWLKTNRKK